MFGGLWSPMEILGPSVAVAGINSKPFLMESGWGLGLACFSVMSAKSNLSVMRTSLSHVCILSCVNGLIQLSATAVGSNTVPLSSNPHDELRRRQKMCTAVASAMAVETAQIFAVCTFSGHN